MANFLASNDFTFVHPSSHHSGSATSGVATGYNVDYHSLSQQNIFSPINCTLPTTIQFPTPSVTSLPLLSRGSGYCQAEALKLPLCNYPAWQPCCLSQQNNWSKTSNLPTWSETSFISSTQPLLAAQMPTTTCSMFGNPNAWSEKFDGDVRPQIRCKRKAVDIHDDCWIPNKVHINEERMSACMSDLRIDNNNVGCHPNLETEPWYSQTMVTDQSSSDVDLENDDTSNTTISSKIDLNKLSRLELCQELQLGMKTKEILPKAILDEVVKQSMQVVLWKPAEQLFPIHPHLHLETAGKSDAAKNGLNKMEEAVTDVNLNMEYDENMMLNYEKSSACQKFISKNEQFSRRSSSSQSWPNTCLSTTHDETIDFEDMDL